MSEKTGPESPFAAFSAAFPPSMSALPGASPEAWQKMWSMFVPPVPGGNAASPFGAMPPSLSMMSELIAPLTNVDELDKRITDMRAVEHWLKLNLQMLQSTTQALEVQRATLATLRAFGAMGASPGAAPASKAAAQGSPSAASGGAAMPGATIPPSLDPTLWWGAINEQFKQLAAAATAATASPAAAGTKKSDGAAPAGSAKPAASGATSSAAGKSAAATSTSASSASSRAPAKSGRSTAARKTNR